MSTADDGTQAQVLARLSAAGVQGKTIAGWLGVSPTVIADYKADRRTLPPWALRRIARRMGTSSVVLGIITESVGELVVRDPGPSTASGSAPLGDKCLRATALLGAFVEAALRAPADRAELHARLVPLRQLLAEINQELERR